MFDVHGETREHTSIRGFDDESEKESENVDRAAEGNFFQKTDA